MEQALLLISLGTGFQRETVDKIRQIPGVDNAHFLYGHYDMYAMIKAKDKDAMRSAVLKIREMTGIKSTVTCNVLQQ